MSWIQKLGRFRSYRATNYVARSPKKICKITLQNEIDSIIKSPKFIPSIINGRSFHGNEIQMHIAPSYGKPLIYNYSYLSPSDYDQLGNFNKLKRKNSQSSFRKNAINPDFHFVFNSVL